MKITGEGTEQRPYVVSTVPQVYAVLRARYADFQLIQQVLKVGEHGEKIDVMSIVLPGGRQNDVYFVYTSAGTAARSSRAGSNGSGQSGAGDLVTSFFTDRADYTRFLVELTKAGRATSDGRCVAFLNKLETCLRYELVWEDGRFLGDFVRYFRASDQNVAMFNAGCAEMACRMRRYLDTDDVDQVPLHPPPFGALTAPPPE